MHDQNLWSLSLGRWFGVHVRLHVFFLLFALLTLYFAWLEGRNPAAAVPEAMGPEAMGLVCLLVLLASVVTHAVVHLAVARAAGGVVEQVILGPLGETSPTRWTTDSRHEFTVLAAGPCANLVLCLAAGSGLVWREDVHLLGLLHPFSPAAVLEGSVSVMAGKLIFWVNWVLALVNVVPVFPFDGGRLLRVALAVGLPDVSPARAAQWVARIAKLTALVLCCAAVWSWTGDARGTVPPWLALSLLALLVFFDARRQEATVRSGETGDEIRDVEESADYFAANDVSAAMCSTRTRPGAIVRWLRRRREERRRRQQQIEALEDLRVDEILSRLHEQGIESLSAEDRALLERVSLRYRARGRRTT